MKLKELFSNIYGIDFTGDWEEEITGIAYSSKDVKPGFLFAALKGQRADGYLYVNEALEKGAKAILSEKPAPKNFSRSWIQVGDPRKVLALVSANFYRHPAEDLEVVGITGTNGKTTVGYILEKILSEAGFTPGVIGTITRRYSGKEAKAQMTTPEAPDLQRILREMKDQGVTHCLMEVSSHGLALDRVMGIDFKVGVFTNLSGDHLDYHQTMENYFSAKKRLFFPDKNEMKAVINIDDLWGRKLISEITIGFITYGVNSEADIQVKDYSLSEQGIQALVRTPVGELRISSSLLGKPNLYNILASIAVALIFNISLQKIEKAISRLSYIPGRFEKIPNNLGINVLVDFAHSDDSLKNLLETARQFKPNRLVLVFGAGGDRDKSKRPRMGEIAGKLSDLSIITSDNPRSEDPLQIIREIEAGIKKSSTENYSIIPDRKEAIFKAISLAEKGDWVIIAGKGHENYQILKDRTIYFDDREVAQQALKIRSEKLLKRIGVND
ncbi:MAG: UDP-N-acetylmuramoyl-L-alanyl-D-glutamate--2,6-diaminopimelate ligase [Candidatus Aminicenantia bacterium]